MEKSSYEMKPHGNHLSQNDLIIGGQTKGSSTSTWLALGVVVVLTVGAVSITALVVTLGNDDTSNSGNSGSLVGIDEVSTTIKQITPRVTHPGSRTTLTQHPHVTDPSPKTTLTQRPLVTDPSSKTTLSQRPLVTDPSSKTTLTQRPLVTDPSSKTTLTQRPLVTDPSTRTMLTQQHDDQTPVSTETPPVTNSPATEAPTNAPVTNPPATNPPVTNPAVTPSAGGTEPPGTTRNSGGGGGIPSQCSMYPCDLSCDMSIAPCNGLIFQEEFDTLNLDIWQHEITAGGGGNWEFQYYTNNRSNSYVKDGKLYLKPTFTEDKLGEGSLESGSLDLWGASPSNLCTGNAWYGCQRTGTATGILNPIQSARIRTVESFSFKYGRLEVEAKLPTGDWLWPAIWLLPKHNVYGDWPASGEIDLMESRGNVDLVDGEGVQAGVNQMGSTMHWGPFWPQNGWPKTHNTKNLPEGETFGDTFHKYRLDWTEDYMKFYVDDELLLTVDPSSGFWDLGEFEEAAPGVDNPWQYNPNKLTPFDQEFYLILNVAVGGTNYFGDGLTNSPRPKPWTNDSPQASKDFWDARADWMPTWQGEEAAMQVNYIRVYAEPGQTTYHLRDR